MNREEQLMRLKETNEWDVIIIGGGASGLGIAVDSASRGFKTILIEAVDFAKGTSSRSTKLAHGGIRYLEQLDIGLIREALKERELMLKNARHLVKNQTFVIPVYNHLNGFYYTAGLKIYDLLAGSTCFGSSKSVSREKTIELLPTIMKDGLKGGIIYHDGQFDDAAFAINLAKTAIENGACIVNYTKAIQILKNQKNQISGIIAEDQETTEKITLKSKVVINATGVFTNNIMKLDNLKNGKTIKPSQGIHLVFDKSFLPGENALLIPKTIDGRVLFIVPWQDKIIVGTTDTLIQEPSLEPLALEEEINFVLECAQKFLTKKPQRSDVLSVFAGLRPLALPKNDTIEPKDISRNHRIIISESGLISVVGGKWTTYRKIAEDVINKTIEIHQLPMVNCKTQNISIHGNTSAKESIKNNHLAIYGTDFQELLQLQKEEPHLNEKLHPNYPYTLSEVAWAIRKGMARTVEDVLARRVRLLFIDAQAAIECCEKVAHLIAKELNRDKLWEQNQIIQFKKTAQGYLLP